MNTASGNNAEGGRDVAYAAAVVRSALFALVFYFGSVPIVVCAMIVGSIAPPRAIAVARFWAGWFSLTTRLVLGIRYRVTGSLPAGTVVVALKHQSAYETIIILRLFRDPAVVVKAELLAIPFWGAAARAHGVIPVDRGDSGGALRTMLRAANAAKAAARPVVIFPEGTRTHPGEAPPLKAGLAGLYRALRVPLVPVALDSGACWPRGFVKYPGIVTFAFGEPIAPGLERGDIEARVHSAINGLT